MAALLVRDKVMQATGVHELDTGRIAESTDVQLFIPKRNIPCKPSDLCKQIFPMCCMLYYTPEPYSGS